MKAKKTVSMKAVVVLLAAVLLVGGAVGGTLAWLLDSTDNVTNTFTVGDINIDLKEHKLQENGTLDNTASGEVNAVKTYKILPGTKQPKDPFVRVKAGSEACYLFVQVKEVNNTVGTEKYVNWAIADGWTQVGTTADGVSTYYKMQDALTATGAEDAVHFVLKGDADFTTGVVTYADTLTKANIEALDADADKTVEENEMPQLIFKAFAVQAEAGADADTAWGAVAVDEKLS